MRVLLAPDGFGATLSPTAAARALADGWSAAAPLDELDLAALSDGGAGLVDVLAAALPAAVRHRRTVEDPLARPVPAELLLDGRTAYVEAAAACGLHLLADAEHDPLRTTTYGVGQLVAAALDLGCERIVIGLGGTPGDDRSATCDGGAGLLAALGVQRVGVDGARLPPGGAALRDVQRLVGRPDPRLAGVELVVATDVDSPLLGLRGTAAAAGPRKGAGREEVALLDGALARWADVLEAHLGAVVRDLPGAGAAGGLGAALLALGATCRSGSALVQQRIGLADRVAGADLVVTGEGAFDLAGRSGAVVPAVVALAGAHAVPCVVVAGAVRVGRREAGAAGITETYSLVEEVGVREALTAPAASLAALSGRVARQWSR